MPSAQPVKTVLVLSENWTLTPPHDLAALVDLAVEAERAGVDAVMISEHIVLGPSADEQGLMSNPREYALPGNQDPATPWPNSLVLLSAIASATKRLRLVAGAIIAPLRHPLVLARELGTLDLLSEGRLVVIPTVGWHKDEYEALGVSFRNRGQLLDEQLAAWEVLWRETPASFRGRHYRFRDVYLNPKAYRADGPRLWFGGSSMHDALVRRTTRYGHGFNPLGRVTDADLDKLATAMSEANRDISELELVGGLRGQFPDDRGPAPLEPALEAIEEQIAQGFRTFCFKPNHYIDDVDEWGQLCREVVAGVALLAPEGQQAAR